MGREVKRVAMDFEWPSGVPWKGYKNPFYKYVGECPACGGCGYNEETKRIGDEFYSFEDRSKRWCDKVTQDEVDALVEAGRLREWRGKEEGWITVPRTAEEVNAVNRDDAPMLGGDFHRHDAINRHILVETRAKRLGVYGLCELCGGAGEVWDSPEYERLAEDWVEEEPPEGDGWQMWETVSEGSPISPVFATPEELAKWLSTNDGWGSNETSYETWLKMIHAGWAPSFVLDGSGVQSGVEYVGNARANYGVQ